ncbi:hypothetical protein ANCDUO_00876 [Ancylostoma duodenale]|uniref:Uncharacterized protein n=1 Tax=Ancylostoma duodenale TaxID=51022 RepID=A0A0C2HAW4_9BILA|nr:hypothetical protein ANCDUO_00876 [Ancylostoma duodenale]
MQEGIRLSPVSHGRHAWLSEVEDSRTEGGYMGSEEGPSSEDKVTTLIPDCAFHAIWMQSNEIRTFI